MTVLVLMLQILGALGVFLYGLKVMSEGLQKAAGAKLRMGLEKATTNPVIGTVSGFLITSVIQSSSATTVMVVAFCSSGLMTLGQSLGVIFGANIGTTTTAWIVSLLGFKIKVSSFAVPLIGIGFFSQFIKRWRTPHRLGQAMVGFGLLFLGLGLLKEAIPNVKDAPEIIEWMGQLDPASYSGLALAIMFGTAMTVVVQSSSASMAITLTAAAKGYIDFPTAAAIALGQNIGTTVTAALAAIGAPLVARRAALAHFLFNLIGSIWPILLLTPFLALVDSLIPGDPYGHTEDTLLVAIPTHIAAFHTAFNICNTLIFLPLTKPFERLIVRLLPEKEGDRAKRTELLYLTTPFGATPELSITAARKEVDRMAGVVLDMMGTIRKAMVAGPAELPALAEKIREDETATDILEHKINEFLASIVHGQLSTPASREALSLLSMINDLERIGDHGEKLSYLFERLSEQKLALSDQAKAELLEMADATEVNLGEMRALIMQREGDPMPEATKHEDELNALRDKLRQAHLDRLHEGNCEPKSGIMFLDIVTSFEKMGDHAYNVVEATVGIK